MSGYAHPESLVDTRWVADHLDDPGIRFVEVTWGEHAEWGMPAYASGHIPGAVAWDFAADLHNSNLTDILNKDALEALLSRSGITPKTTIVLYSGLNNLLATFTFWLLKIYRHRDVRLLDGDRQKWLDERRPLARDVPTFAPTEYRLPEPDWSIRASREAILRSLGNEDTLPVDARTSEMYRGDDSAGAAHGGHIPGAINLPARAEMAADGSFVGWRVPTVQQDGTFKSTEDLRSIFGELRITPDKTLITYCVRGGLSTHAWFVLTQLLGYSDVREYDRSWAEWGNAADVPIEQ